MGKLHPRIIFRAADHNFSPQSRTFEDIGFVDGENFLATFHCEGEGDARNAFDSLFAVSHSVGRDAGAGYALNGARLSEVEASQQLPYDHYVGAANQISAEWGTIFERGKADGGTKVRVGAEVAAQAEQSSFGAKMARVIIVCGASDGTKEYR